MEPPSMLFAMFVMDRFGRKPTLAGSLIICGLSCFMTGFTTKGTVQHVTNQFKLVLMVHFSVYLVLSDWVYQVKIDSFYADMPSWEMVFSLTSKFFISVVTGTLFSYTAELFPTSTRSSALGICSSMGKVGAILAPSLAEMVQTPSFNLQNYFFTVISNVFYGVNIIISIYL